MHHSGSNISPRASINHECQGLCTLLSAYRVTSLPTYMHSTVLAYRVLAYSASTVQYRHTNTRADSTARTAFVAMS